MKINDSLTVQNGYDLSQVGNSGSSKAAGQPQKTGVANDQATLSVDGPKLEDLKAKLNGVPEIRQEKVNQLRQAIHDGSYKVSDGDIAGAMLSDLLR